MSLADGLAGGRTLDFSNDGSSSDPYPAGRIAVGHIGGQVPLGVPQPVIFEFIDQPAGYIDLHCPDCASEVSLLAGWLPPQVDAAFAVRHSDGCPVLARARRQDGAP
jgi:hypothetical protein